MHETGSFLYTAVEAVRAALEQSNADKYTDDYVVRNIIGQAYGYCIQQLNMGSDDIIICKSVLTIVDGTTEYELPPTVDFVVRLIFRDAEGKIITDFRPNHVMHPLGCGWRLEGNMLVFDPELDVPSPECFWEIWYAPSGDMCMHYADDGVVGVDKEYITLSTAPELGLIDRRPNAYAGSVIRILHTGFIWQERIIASYDATTGRVVPRIPFNTAQLPDEGEDVTYEIAPLARRPIWDMVSAYAALLMGETRDVPQKRLVTLDTAYKRAKKAANDRLGNMNARVAKHTERNTVDSDIEVDVWRLNRSDA